jgi:hypothetical protein
LHALDKVDLKVPVPDVVAWMSPPWPTELTAPLPPNEVHGALCVLGESIVTVNGDGPPPILFGLASAKPITTILIAADLRINVPDREPSVLKRNSHWIMH